MGNGEWGLGGEAVVAPAGGGIGTGVEEAIVEAVFAALPEFQFAGDDAEAAPEGGEGDVAFAEFAFHFLPFLDQGLAVGEDAALGGGPGGELGIDGALDEVGKDLGGGYAFGHALDGHLPLEGDPGEEEGDLGVLGDLSGFTAFEVGEEDEAAGVPVFEEDGAGGGTEVGADGGGDHGIGFGDAGLAGLFEPETELFEGIVVEFEFVEVAESVIGAHAGQVGGRQGGRRRGGGVG